MHEGGIRGTHPAFWNAVSNAQTRPARKAKTGQFLKNQVRLGMGLEGWDLKSTHNTCIGRKKLALAVPADP